MKPPRLAEVIPFRPRISADQFMIYLAENVAPLQAEAVRIQKAGLRYGEIVVPRKYEGHVSEGVTLLGRRVVAADVQEIGFIVRPPIGA